MVDVYSKAKRREIMSKIRTGGTNPEEKLALMLDQLKVKYGRNIKSLPGNPDLVVFTAQLAIFAHGCFWHGHPNCKRGGLPQTNVNFWEDKIGKNRKRDARVVRQLRRRGWHVMIVWECKLRRPERVAKRLTAMLRKGR